MVKVESLEFIQEEQGLVVGVPDGGFEIQIRIQMYILH
jgi:hypothetical protein